MVLGLVFVNLLLSSFFVDLLVLIFAYIFTSFWFLFPLYKYVIPFYKPLLFLFWGFEFFIIFGLILGCVMFFNGFSHRFGSYRSVIFVVVRFFVGLLLGILFIVEVLLWLVL